jgi:hypothetical protein
MLNGERPLLPVALEYLRVYVERTALLRRREITVADCAANRPLVDPEQSGGVPR